MDCRLILTLFLAALHPSSGFLPQNFRFDKVSPRGQSKFAEESPSMSPTPNEVSDTMQPSDATTPATPTAPQIQPINGWVPEEASFCYGLPGALLPMGQFDPLGFCQSGIPLNDVKRYRESEVMHGRVAMLASVGFLVGESFKGPFSLTGPASEQLDKAPFGVVFLLAVLCGAAETHRAQVGWMEPSAKTLWTLRDSYYPGDIGFDPLGLKPKAKANFADMQTRELQNGRLAMLGVAGMCAQELVNHKTIAETFDFYQKVYSGINPYE